MKTGCPPIRFMAFLLSLTSAAWSQEPGTRHAEAPGAVLARVPEKARLRSNPLEGDPEAVAAGKKLFEMHCAECHGKGADGTRRGPSLRVDELQHATPGEIFWILTNGVVRRGMPAWSKLPEPQRWQIITYLRRFGDPARAGNLGPR